MTDIMFQRDRDQGMAGEQTLQATIRATRLRANSTLPYRPAPSSHVALHRWKTTSLERMGNPASAMANVLDRDFTLIKETDHQDNREFLPRKAVSKDISKSRSPTTSCHNVSLDGSDTPAHRSSVPRLSIPADSGSSCKESPLSVKSSSSSVSSDNSSVYSLRLDTGSNCAQDILFEVALEITEEMARLCDVSRPLPTDVSLVTAGLTPSAIGRLRLWLETRFDYHSSVKRLMKDAVTAESLAADVVAQSSPFTPWSHGEIPIVLDGECIFPFLFSPEAVSEPKPEPPKKISLPPSPSIHVRRARKVDLSLDLPRVPTSASSQWMPARSPANAPLPRTPTPPSATLRRHYGKSSLDVGNGRKAGLVVGLLAVGALMGSPATPSFEYDVLHRGSSSPNLQTIDSPLHSAFASSRLNPNLESALSGGGAQVYRADTPHNERHGFRWLPFGPRSPGKW